VNWLLRQAKEMPPNLRVEARYPNVREPVAVLLEEARKHPERLLYGADPKREARVFRLTLAAELGLKRDAGQGSFLSASRQQLQDFYRGVVQGLRPWQPAAPKLPLSEAARLSAAGTALEPQAEVITISELTDAGQPTGDTETG
jgi:hypothetical protein